jgi:hypothetical protein
MASISAKACLKSNGLPMEGVCSLRMCCISEGESGGLKFSGGCVSGFGGGVGGGGGGGGGGV